jgi:hypothetical protein
MPHGLTFPGAEGRLCPARQLLPTAPWQICGVDPLGHSNATDMMLVKQYHKPPAIHL